MNSQRAFPFRRVVRAAAARFAANLLAVALLACAGASVEAAPAADEWITVNKDYSSQRYVDLDQITPANVGGLKEVCETNLNMPAWFNSGMLFVGQTIYVDTLRSTFAIDAETCELRWRYDVELTRAPASNGNRGPAYLDGLIFRGTPDGRIIALAAETGKLVWQTQGANPANHESFLAAPVAWDGKVFAGTGISDSGVIGRVMAFDAKTGRELWRFNTIPIGIEPGAETWSNQGSPPAGGGFWTGLSLDPATRELFAPAANPFPDYSAASRPGNNLYTDSVLALDTATGKLNWYHQDVVNDDHDWDLGTPPTLYRAANGKDMVAIVGKEGVIVGIDRASKTVVFRTPGTTIANAGRVDDTLKLVCPGSIGGAQWNGAAYHPGLGMLFAGMVDWCFYYSTRDYSGNPGFWLGAEDNGGTVRPNFSNRPGGWITAIDGATGRLQWRRQTDGQVIAGLVPTKSGLLFAGDVRGNLFALDAKSGAVLKHIDAGGALNHGLVSYEIGANQYVAAAVGGLTLNANGVAGPLRVVVYGLNGTDSPKTVILDRGRLTPIAGPPELESILGFVFFCGTCHSSTGKRGGVGPPLVLHSELGDPKVLKAFLLGVPPPMPILYPGLLEDNDIESLAAYLKTLTIGENPKAPGAYAPPTTAGSKPWQAVYSVLTAPRCINCHTVTGYPRQTDIRYPHIFSIIRGPDNKGAPVGRCEYCHGSENNAETGVPGRSGWSLAPITMAWESAPGVAMTGPELCSMLRDRLRNGNRDLAQLVEHVKTEHLVLWAWDPGTRWNGDARKTPPISHDDFVSAFQEWVDAGAACPAQ
jgi:alcohol dehydrogenase (cytochrome c)